MLTSFIHSINPQRFGHLFCARYIVKAEDWAKQTNSLASQSLPHRGADNTSKRFLWQPGSRIELENAWGHHAVLKLIWDEIMYTYPQSTWNPVKKADRLSKEIRCDLRCGEASTDCPEGHRALTQTENGCTKVGCSEMAMFLLRIAE